MWTRAQVKRSGKIAFKSNYGKTVLAAVVLSIASGGITFTVSLSDTQLETLARNMNTAMLMQLLSASAPGLILTLIISVFLLAPLEVGCRRFFIRNGKMPAKMGECLSGFKSNYWNVILTMFLESIYLNLWYLLFVIPGIVKTYSYRMVPYILAENPDLPPNEVITRSRQLMKGHKWKAFVLDLSFIGWEILSVFTLGILDFLYVLPYQYSANAELYRVLRGAEPVEGPADGENGGYYRGYDSHGREEDPYDDGPYDEPDRHDDDPYNGYI